MFAQNARTNGGGAAAAPQTAIQANDVTVSPVVDERELGLNDAVPASVEKNDPSSFGTVLRTVLALFITAAAIYGVVYILKRLTRQTEVKDPHLKVLATTHLGSNRFVHVVSLGQKAWLIGASDGGVELIAEVDDPETRDALLLEDSRRQAERSNAFSLDFKAMLRKLSGGEIIDAGPGADSIRKRRERLRGL